MNTIGEDVETDSMFSACDHQVLVFKYVVWPLGLSMTITWERYETLGNPSGFFSLPHNGKLKNKIKICTSHHAPTRYQIEARK